MSRRKVNKAQTAVTAFVVLIASTALAIQSPKNSELETTIGTWVYRWPEFLLPPMLVVTQLGNVIFALLVVAFLTALHKYRLALRVVMAACLAYISTSVLKLVVHRPRPADQITDIISREGLTFGFGYPSGHTALAVALGLTIMPIIPSKYRWLVFVVMALVATSRLYLGVHSPLDVIGGAAIGVLAAYGVQSIRRVAPFLKT